MKIYTIYKATCLSTNLCYIGFDSRWPSRMKEHKKAAENKKKQEYWFTFHKVIREFGWNNFEWEIIYQSLDGQFCFEQMENHFIQQYNSLHNGYNMTEGGKGNLGWVPKQNTLEKMRLAKKDKYNGENNPSWKGGKITKSCAICSTSFIVFPGSKKKYCSINCGKLMRGNKGNNHPKYKGPLPIKLCMTCQQPFQLLRHHHPEQHKYCSRPCQNLGRRK